MELHAGHHTVVQWMGLSFHIDTLYMTWLTMAIVIVITMLATRKRALVPSGIQNVVEMVLETLKAEFAPNLGKHWSKVSSLLFTFFLFICIGNELGLLPSGGKLFSPTADINTTLGFALASSAVVWATGIRIKGIGFFKHFFEPYVALFVLNVFEEIAKVVTLAARLFGNILAGEILLEVMYNLLPAYVPLEWAWIAFSLVIGVIQAFIFTVLTSSYLSQVVAEH